MAEIGERKADHIALCAEDGRGLPVAPDAPRECVRLVHDALPDLAVGDVDTSVTVLGKKLRAPIIIASMTGGTEEAGVINRELALLAEERGYGFGLGSQRAMFLRAGTGATYRVRQNAPSTLLRERGRGSGGKRGREDERGTGARRRKVGADALCVHLNPAMEPRPARR